MLKHSDLKSSGLYLTQLEAQEIQSKISGISQGHISDGIVYNGTDKAYTKETKEDPLKAYYAEVSLKNIELKRENIELVNQLRELNSKLSSTVTKHEDDKPKVKRGPKPKLIK